MSKKSKPLTIGEMMPIENIKENPANPRTITKEKFRKLVQSIKEFPEMLIPRPIVVNPLNVVLGGNMRLKACIEAGLKEVPVYKATWEELKQNQFLIKDNVSYGDWDWDVLANNWQNTELQDWGLNVWTGDEAFALTEEDAVTEEEPKISHTHDGFVLFELVMKIENKNILVSTINKIKQESDLSKVEDALMEIIHKYNANK